MIHDSNSIPSSKETSKDSYRYEILIDRKVGEKLLADENGLFSQGLFSQAEEQGA